MSTGRGEALERRSGVWWPRRVLDAVTDLLLGGHCVGCVRPGRLLCAHCAGALPRTGRPAWPSPAPPGLVGPWAAAAYDGTVRAMVLGHKEHRLLALRRPLGDLLAAAVEAAAGLPGGAGPLVLVPVPSRPAGVRARGHDPTHAMTRAAAAALRRRGYDALAVRMLHLRPGVVDQAGLDAEGRRANLAGSMACPSASLRRLAARRPRARVVVCDDVLTTGVTVREAQRALEAAGVPVVAVAVVAATARRRPARSPEAGPDHSAGPRLSCHPGTD